MDNGKNVAAAARDAAIAKLNVGTRVQLRAQRDGGQVEYFSSLIGFVKDEYLLVRTPVIRKAPVVLHDGEPVLVRAFTGTTIYSFSATVERILNSPLSFVQLSYPDQIDGAALRSALRDKVGLQAEAHFSNAAGQAQQASGKIVNLSISGAAFETGVAIPMRADLRVSFSIEGESAPRTIDAAAQVRSVHLRSAAGAGSKEIVTCGLQFQGVDSADLMAIRLMTYDTLLRDRQNIA